MPTVSVVLPVYKAERFLGQCLDSLWTQTYKDFEVLVVEDPSSDGTAAVLKKQKDPRLRVIRNSTRKGLVFCMNQGIAEAKGKYIARQDSDDVSLPERFQVQLDFLKANPCVGMLGTAYKLVDKNGRTVLNGQPETHAHILQEILPKYNQFAHGSLMMPKDMLQAIGCYRDIKYAEDYDMFMRMSERFPVINLPQPLYMWRFSLTSTSVSKVEPMIMATPALQELSRQRKQFGKDALDHGLPLPNVDPLPRQFIRESFMWYAVLAYRCGEWEFAFNLLDKAITWDMTTEAMTEWILYQMGWLLFFEGQERTLQFANYAHTRFGGSFPSGAQLWQRAYSKLMGNTNNV